MESFTNWANDMKAQVNKLQEDAKAEYERVSQDYEHSKKAFAVLDKDIQASPRYRYGAQHKTPSNPSRRGGRRVSTTLTTTPKPRG